MPARGAIILADAESTPVTHTFSPHGDVSNGVAMFRNLNSSNVGASETLTIGLRDSLAKPEDYQVPGKQVSPRKYTMKLNQPITYVDAGSGLTLIKFVNTIKVESLLHPTATAQQCFNLRKMVGNLLIGTANYTADTHDLGIPLW